MQCRAVHAVITRGTRGVTLAPTTILLRHTAEQMTLSRRVAEETGGEGEGHPCARSGDAHAWTGRTGDGTERVTCQRLGPNGGSGS